MKIPKAKTYGDPVYLNLFEVEYISSELSIDEKMLLLNNTHKIDGDVLSININEGENGGIPILKILQKMNRFNLSVKLYNKLGNILGFFKYYGCELLPNKMETIVKLSWEITQYDLVEEIMRISLKFKYDDIEYVDVENYDRYIREQKLKRLLKQR